MTRSLICYKGMIQSKGTAESLSRIGRSNSIVQGSMEATMSGHLRQASLVIHKMTPSNRIKN